MATPPPDFDLIPALDDELTRSAIAVTRARRVVALTGAGLSLESGIPGEKCVLEAAETAT
jgi:hypothetical protein